MTARLLQICSKSMQCCKSMEDYANGSPLVHCIILIGYFRKWRAEEKELCSTAALDLHMPYVTATLISEMTRGIVSLLTVGGIV